MEPKSAEPVSLLLKPLREHGAVTSEQVDLARKILAISTEASKGGRHQGISAIN